MISDFELLEDIIRSYDPEIEVVAFDRWASDMVNKAVYIGPKLNDEERTMSLHGYEYWDLDVKCSPDLFALFHEIGHVVTASRLSKKEREHLLVDYTVHLNRLMQDKEITDEEFIEKYWAIKAEQMANRWAVAVLSSFHDIEIMSYENILDRALASEEMVGYNNFDILYQLGEF